MCRLRVARRLQDASFSAPLRALACLNMIQKPHQDCRGSVLALLLRLTVGACSLAGSRKEVPSIYSSRIAILVVTGHSYWCVPVSRKQYTSLEARVRLWYAGTATLAFFSRAARVARLYPMLFCLIVAAELYQLMAEVAVVDWYEVLWLFQQPDTTALLASGASLSVMSCR